MHGNCPKNQRNDRNSVEQDQKSIELKEVHHELAHQIWAKSNQQSVCKCTGNFQQISGQETKGIPRSMTKSYSDLERPIRTWPTEFKLNPISSVSANGWNIWITQRPDMAKIQRSVSKTFAHKIWAQFDQQFVWFYTWKLWEFSGLWPKLIIWKAQSCSGQWRLYSKQKTSPWSQAKEQLPATWAAWLLYDNTW